MIPFRVIFKEAGYMRLNNLLIVCVGNICRSLMAEYLLRAETERGLDSWKDRIRAVTV